MDEVFDVVSVNEADVYGEQSLGLTQQSEIGRIMALRANDILAQISKMLYKAPAFVRVVKSVVPKEVLVAVLTDEQKAKIASGALQLMAKKDGSLLATLINPVTKRTVSKITLQNVKLTPAISQAMTEFSSQMQMAQIAEKIELIQKAVDDVRQGLEYDRLAIAYSCQQKFLQISKFANPEMKNAALLRIAMDAEDSRNLLMLSQKANIRFILEQPESLWEKIIKGAHPKEISSRMNEIRDSLYAINAVSLVEAVAYQEIGEIDAARQSLLYYGNYVRSAFLGKAGFIKRLDQIDDSPESYWTGIIPDIVSKTLTLPDRERS